MPNPYLSGKCGSLGDTLGRDAFPCQAPNTRGADSRHGFNSHVRLCDEWNVAAGTTDAQCPNAFLIDLVECREVYYGGVDVFHPLIEVLDQTRLASAFPLIGRVEG